MKSDMEFDTTLDQKLSLGDVLHITLDYSSSIKKAGYTCEIVGLEKVGKIQRVYVKYKTFFDSKEE